MTAGQIAALVVLVAASVVALLHTTQEACSMWKVLQLTVKGRGWDLSQYKITIGLLGVAVGDSVLALAYWLVLG